jgi:hypothetical protein
MTLSLQEFLVRPRFRDAPIDKDDDFRTFGNGIISMCGEQNHLGLIQLSKEFEDRTFSLWIQTGYRLVQNHHGGILIDKPRESEALPLPAGEVKSSAKSCPDQGIDPLWQPVNHLT